MTTCAPFRTDLAKLRGGRAAGRKSARAATVDATRRADWEVRRCSSAVSTCEDHNRPKALSNGRRSYEQACPRALPSGECTSHDRPAAEVLRHRRRAVPSRWRKYLEKKYRGRRSRPKLFLAKLVRCRTVPACKAS